MTDFDRESMLEMFIHEMSQLIDQLEATIVQSESEYNNDQINEIFRIMHTIKGSSAMMMFDNVADVAHIVEDLFYYLREENPKNVDYGRLSDYVLSGADFVKVELAKLQDGGKSDGDGTALAKTIEAFLAELKKGGTGSTVPPPAQAPAAHSAPVVQAPPDIAPVTATPAVSTPASTPNNSKNKYSGRIFFQDGCEMENIRAFTLIHNLNDVAEDIIHTPKDIINEASIHVIRENGFEFEFTSTYDYDYIHSHLSQTVYLRELVLNGDESSKRAPAPVAVQSTVPTTIKISLPAASDAAAAPVILTPVPASAAPPPAAPVTAAAPPPSPPEPEPEPVSPVPAEPAPEPAPLPDNNVQQTADAEKAAAAEEVNQRKGSATQSMISVNVSKLDILVNIMSELVMSEAMVTQNPELDGLQLDSFTKEARHLRKIIDNLHQTVMSMRMVPVSATFFRMHRLVRDMCRQLNKDVQLDIVGEETEVDKNIIEQIADPIMHIIRNSIDHGVEFPEEREKAGKLRKARVLLEARNAGGDILIIITDNGRGINTEKVLKKARENGLLTKQDYEYTEKEIQQFIFLPGFSTNEQVTAYSGRGVGMDVVSSNLTAIGGSVLVDSIPGEGTTFTLKIPLTLAIIQGMSVMVADAQYTIPIVSIVKSFKAKPEDLFIDPSGNEMITERGVIYNIVRLHEFFNIEGAITDISEGTLVMIENGDQAICLLVDKLMGQQQAVLKPMPKYFNKIRGLSGCTLLGNGDISLIIDVPGFFD